jgi:BMFP domain-containing protein YqiC
MMMVQTTNRFFDEMARLMNDAAGVAGGVRKEVETIFQAQAEKILRNLDVVTREEFEAAKEMAAKAREENDRLAVRLAEIEKQLAAFQTPNG